MKAFSNPSYDVDPKSVRVRSSGVESATPATSGVTRWLALGAIVGPVLFTLGWLILGFLSPGFTIFGTRIEPYSPISAPISGLGLGLTAPSVVYHRDGAGSQPMPGKILEACRYSTLRCQAVDAVIGHGQSTG